MIREKTMSRPFVLVAGLLAAVGCDRVVEVLIERPTNLTYRLEPSGDPDAPAGVLLEWDAVQIDNLDSYNIYSRPTNAGAFDLRATTTSTTFHDVGIPDLYYAVAAVGLDGEESGLSEEVFIDERLRLDSPNFLNTTSLDGAIHLAWADNAFQSEPDGFQQYRVYSAGFSLDDNLCDASWSLEGTTVAPEFLAGALDNGQPRCFAVASESIEGWESLWSEIRADTPRPDARNVLVFNFTAGPAQSGFRFFQDLNGDGQAGPLELGIVGSGAAAGIDFFISRDALTGDVFFEPVRTGVAIALYDPVNPVADLTSIDIAPARTEFQPTPISVVPGFAYVFEMVESDLIPRYGAIRPTHVGVDYVIFDWSYQTDPGNPELHRHGGLQTAAAEGIVVKR